MTEQRASIGVTHDQAAHLLGLTPRELEMLVADGHVRRNDKSNYSVPVLVGDYVAHLRASVTGTVGHPSQAEVAAHLDLSDRSVRELEPKLALPSDYNLASFRIAYIRHLREVAAGRGGENSLELAAERARLAKEQADKIAMANAITRGELAPARLIEEVIARAGARMARLLDTIPGLLRRRLPSLSADDVAAVAQVVAKARNVAASMTLEELDDDDDATLTDIDAADFEGASES